MWNDDGKLSVRAKKIVIYILSILLTAFMFFVVYKWLISQGSTNIELYISAAAMLLTIVGYILSVTNNLIAQQINTKLDLKLEVNVTGDFAILTCSIENKGQQRIDPIAFHIFIDQLVLNDSTGIYNTNHILKHDCKHNCKLSEMCRQSNISAYPEEFMLDNDGLYYAVKKLDFLAPDSMLYVNPGEHFSEDIAFKLNKGVYRVLLIGVFDKKGCLCANKQFVID